ncbi:Pyrroline-5-carboxylate reductase [hydrothermal vent metagenome]|uniref:Pyrroline-5-carboxylate reductase n=1 Tax=hydrothermal vent metagenome TaxID=652676 RepID=A0A3B0T8C8_9ZZZZ
MNIDEIGAVVLVGAGQMGMALATGWLAAGLDRAKLTLVDPAPRQSTVDFAKTNNLKLVDEAPGQPFSVLVIAVKPQIIAPVMAQITPRISSDTLIISIAAGISLNELYRGLGSKRIVRAMPNTPAQVKKGASGAIAGSGVTEKNRIEADILLSASGLVVWLGAESEMDALTAVSGSGPAYVFLLVEAMAAAGVKQGLAEETALMLARQTIIGAAGLLEADPAPAAVLRKNVTSPNGTTAAALAVLMAKDGLTDLMTKAIEAATKRSRELGEPKGG